MINTLDGQRVFVTGATGFIGSYLARRLRRAGAHVLGLERTPGKGSSLASEGIEMVHGDITDHARMVEILHQYGVQIVLHLAAWLGQPPDPDLAHRINVVATRSLAEASAAMGVKRFVFTSSIAVYGAFGDRDVDETTPVEPFGDPYGDSKIRAEQTLAEIGHSMGLPFVIIRPGMVYGPGSPGWTVRLARWAKRGRLPLLGGGRGIAYPIYIDNLIDLLILCTVHESAPSEVFNAIDDGPATMGAFLSAYMQMVPTNRAIRLPCWLGRVAAGLANPFIRRWDLPYVVSQICGRGRISNRKAKERLGWSPRVGPDEGLRRSEAWLRAQGIL